MTIRTLNYLKNTLLATGQAAGSITPARMQDIIDTMGLRGIYVTDYGALGDGNNDDTAAINNAIASVRGTGKGGHIIFPPGIYKTTGPINMTGFGPSNNWYDVLYVTGYGAIIDCHMTGGAAVDMFSTRWVVVRGLSIHCDETTSPAFGIQIGRISAAEVDNIRLDDVRILGAASKASLYIYAAEDCLFTHVHCENTYSAGCYALVVDSSNNFGATSTFVTQTNAAGQIRSTFDNNFVSCEFWNTVSSNTSCIWMNGCGRTTFRSNYFTTWAAASCITLDLSQSGYPIRELRVDAHCENNPNLLYIFLLTGTNASPLIAGLMYHDMEMQANGPNGGSVFKRAGSVSTVGLYNADINLTSYWFTPTPMWDNAASYNVTGNFKLPNPNAWTNPASFHGTRLVGSDFNSTPSYTVVA